MIFLPVDSVIARNIFSFVASHPDLSFFADLTLSQWHTCLVLDGRESAKALLVSG